MSKANSEPIYRELGFRGVVLTLLLTVLGCGDGKPRPYALTGTVTIDGQPAEGVQLTFYPIDPPAKDLRVPAPVGFTDESGEFKASTYTGGDGAPAGDYR